MTNLLKNIIILYSFGLYGQESLLDIKLSKKISDSSTVYSLNVRGENVDGENLSLEYMPNAEDFLSTLLNATRELKWYFSNTEEDKCAFLTLFSEHLQTYIRIGFLQDNDVFSGICFFSNFPSLYLSISSDVPVVLSLPQRLTLLRGLSVKSSCRVCNLGICSLNQLGLKIRCYGSDFVNNSAHIEVSNGPIDIQCEHSIQNKKGSMINIGGTVFLKGAEIDNEEGQIVSYSAPSSNYFSSDFLKQSFQKGYSFVAGNSVLLLVRPRTIAHKKIKTEFIGGFINNRRGVISEHVLTKPSNFQKRYPRTPSTAIDNCYGHIILDKCILRMQDKGLVFLEGGIIFGRDGVNICTDTLDFSKSLDGNQGTVLTNCKCTINTLSIIGNGFIEAQELLFKSQKGVDSSPSILLGKSTRIKVSKMTFLEHDVDDYRERIIDGELLVDRLISNVKLCLKGNGSIKLLDLRHKQASLDLCSYSIDLCIGKIRDLFVFSLIKSIKDIFVVLDPSITCIEFGKQNLGQKSLYIIQYDDNCRDTAHHSLHIVGELDAESIQVCTFRKIEGMLSYGQNRKIMLFGKEKIDLIARGLGMEVATLKSKIIGLNTTGEPAQIGANVQALEKLNIKGMGAVFFQDVDMPADVEICAKQLSVNASVTFGSLRGNVDCFLVNTVGNEAVKFLISMNAFIKFKEGIIRNATVQSVQGQMELEVEKKLFVEPGITKSNDGLDVTHHPSHISAKKLLTIKLDDNASLVNTPSLRLSAENHVKR